MIEGVPDLVVGEPLAEFDVVAHRPARWNASWNTMQRLPGAAGRTSPDDRPDQPIASCAIVDLPEPVGPTERRHAALRDARSTSFIVGGPSPS